MTHQRLCSAWPRRSSIWLARVSPSCAGPAGGQAGWSINDPILIITSTRKPRNLAIRPSLICSCKRTLVTAHLNGNTVGRGLAMPAKLEHRPAFNFPLHWQLIWWAVSYDLWSAGPSSAVQPCRPMSCGLLCTVTPSQLVACWPDFCCAAS